MCIPELATTQPELSTHNDLKPHISSHGYKLLQLTNHVKHVTLWQMICDPERR